jgi:monothiol glutaredoxin
MSIVEKLQQQIHNTPIILYMKGTPEMPQCGFSARVVQVLKECGAHFESVDVLAEPEIRATLPKVSDWPTFPQLFVNGALIGGCDIVLEMHAEGSLLPLINQVQS